MAVEDVEDADAAVAVVMDHPVTVTGPARTVETLRLAVAVERPQGLQQRKLVQITFFDA